MVVTNNNRAPQISPIGPQRMGENTTLDFAVFFDDPDEGDAHQVSITSLNETIGVTGEDTGSGSAFKLVPVEDFIGGGRIEIAVSDDGTPALTTVTSFTVEVVNVNDAPLLTPINGQTVAEGEPGVERLFSDPDIEDTHQIILGWTKMH